MNNYKESFELEKEKTWTRNTVVVEWWFMQWVQILNGKNSHKIDGKMFHNF